MSEAIAEESFISTCNQVLSAQNEIRNFFQDHEDVADADEAILDKLTQAKSHWVTKLANMGAPKTMEDLVACARTALAIHVHKSPNGDAIADSDSEFLALTICEALSAVSVVAP